MSQSNELKFQRGTTTNTEGEQGKEGRSDHAHDRMAVAQKSLGFLSVSELSVWTGARAFEQA